MASSRLFYINYLTQQSFNAFNVAGGAVAMVPSGWSPYYPYAAGGVQLETRGTYTGVFELDYLIEIQSSTDGTFPNSRWRWSDDGGATWDVQNITPVSGTWVTLNNGLEVRFNNTGTTPQFVAGDYYTARAIRPYGIVKALDGGRNSEFRSGTTPASSTIRIAFDLTTAQQPGLFILDDHNLPATATITLFAHATTPFTETGGGSQVIPWAANRMAALVTVGPFRYWWIRVVMPATGQPPFLRFSGLWLGPGVTLRKCPTAGGSANLDFLSSIDMQNIATRGPHPRVYTAEQLALTWRRVRLDTGDDGGKLAAALTYAKEHSTYTMPPLWVLLNDDVVSTVELYSWVGSGLQRQHVVANQFDVGVNFAQVIRTVAA